jgi:drug/metabolite transporter (DMT)-like permease
MKLAGIILIIIGLVFLVYQGFTFTTTKKDVDLGPIQVQHQEEHSIPFPPIIGAVCVAGGVAALVLGARNK